MKCSELVCDDPTDTRKITSLTVYRRKSAGGSDSQLWEELARVTSQSPLASKVADAKRINGSLSDSKAELTVVLLKSIECLYHEFSCVALLVDNKGQKSEMKSVIRGNSSLMENSKLEPEAGDDGSWNDQPGTVRKVETFMAILLEKLKYIETRLDDSRNRDDKLENKLESLEDKISDLERSVTRDIDVSGDRIEDKMDRIKDRLEDKLSRFSAGKPLHMNESECLIGVCTNISSQMNTVESSVELLDKSLNSLAGQVRDIGVSMPKGAALENKLNQIVTEVTGISTVTNNLTASVDVLTRSCADKTPTPVDEFFDVLGTGEKEWRLAFRGTAYNNVEIYPAYMLGTGIPAEVEAGCKQFNYSLPCANHYRNRDALENWANVDKVLLALYVKGQIVKQILFNGKGSTFTNWFNGQRVLQSSWNDLKKKTHNIFSIIGDARVHLLRRFMINHAYGGCAKDNGWLVVGDVVPGGCSWEKKLARPAFIYAKRSTSALWISRDVARADAMGIFIKYQ